MQHLTGTRGEVAWRLEINTPNNTITPGLLSDLAETLEQHEGQSSARILSLQGIGAKFFSPGFDLAQVAISDRPAMADLIRQFEETCVTLLRHPKPTIAVINGDCLAGGFILASCCDFRIARDSVQIGMTPLNLSITVPVSAHRILEHRLGYRLTRDLVLTGRSFSAGEAGISGWIDDIFEPDAEGSCLARWTSRLLKSDAAAYRTSKRLLLQSLVDSLKQPEPQELEAFLDCWFSPATRRRLRSTLRRLSRG